MKVCARADGGADLESAFAVLRMMGAEGLAPDRQVGFGRDGISLAAAQCSLAYPVTSRLRMCHNRISHAATLF